MAEARAKYLMQVDGSKSGSAKTTPAGINSLKELQMQSLSKFIGKLQLTNARESLEDENYMKMIFDIDREFNTLKSQIEDLEKKVEDTKSNKPEEKNEEENVDQPNQNNVTESKTENKMKDKKEIQQQRSPTPNTEIQQLKEKVEEMKKLADNVESKLTKTEKDKSSFKDEAEKWKTEYERLRSLAEEKIRNLNEECAGKSYEVERLNVKISNASQQIERYEENRTKLNQQIEDLKLRLSQVAGSKLSENNPSITDLSDPNRPQKIAEQFSEVYDNEWTDALEMLQGSGKDERSATDILLNTLKVCFEYCRIQSEKQKDQIANALLPTEAHDWSTLTTEVVKAVKDLRKMTDLEEHWVSWLEQDFLKTEEYQSFPEERIEEQFISYIRGCLKCGWLSYVQDPPVVLDFDLEQFSQFDSNYTKQYTKTGKYVDFVVWPCMVRCKDGPLLSKGVVQCTSDAGPGKVPKVSSAVDLTKTTDTAETKEGDDGKQTGTTDPEDKEQSEQETTTNATDTKPNITEESADKEKSHSTTGETVDGTDETIDTANTEKAVKTSGAPGKEEIDGAAKESDESENKMEQKDVQDTETNITETTTSETTNVDIEKTDADDTKESKQINAAKMDGEAPSGITKAAPEPEIGVDSKTTDKETESQETLDTKENSSDKKTTTEENKEKKIEMADKPSDLTDTDKNETEKKVIAVGNGAEAEENVPVDTKEIVSVEKTSMDNDHSSEVVCKKNLEVDKEQESLTDAKEKPTKEELDDTRNDAETKALLNLSENKATTDKVSKEKSDAKNLEIAEQPSDTKDDDQKPKGKEDSADADDVGENDQSPINDKPTNKGDLKESDKENSEKGGNQSDLQNNTEKDTNETK